MTDLAAVVFMHSLKEERLWILSPSSLTKISGVKFKWGLIITEILPGYQAILLWKTEKLADSIDNVFE